MSRPVLAAALAMSFGTGMVARAEAPMRAPSPGEVASNINLAPASYSIDVEEHLGNMLDPGIPFVDHTGKAVKLGDYFDGKRPVLLTLNYFRCPVMCNVQLNNLTDTFREFDWTPGDEHFRVVTVSIDPREDAALAGAKRKAHLDALGRGDDVDWAFLTAADGDALGIRLLAAQLGISYAYDPEQDQYAHPGVVTFVSPEGKIARYVYGLSYVGNDLKFGLLEAAEGRVGTTLDRFILSCFHYDASLGRYGLFAFGLLRLAGALSVLLIGTALLIFWRRERRVARREERS
ncbi:MAG: SCO family protein [Myxococcales bacterium]|nr:SCO family protein [Myxococcales bacterium]